LFASFVAVFWIKQRPERVLRHYNVFVLASSPAETWEEHRLKPSSFRHDSYDYGAITLTGTKVKSL
jgi:hypothetical protein